MAGTGGRRDAQAHTSEGENRAGTLPHEHVWARLGVSGINGVGVIAIRSIPAGTALFVHDQAAIRWISTADLENGSLTDAEQQLYRDFAIRREGKLGCPASFDLLTPGWYMNEPAPGDQPNVHVGASYAMTASRDIAAGEELTISYASFSDGDQRIGKRE